MENIEELDLFKVEEIAKKYGLSIRQAVDIYDEIKGIARTHSAVTPENVTTLTDLINTGKIKSPEPFINTVIRDGKLDTNLISDGYHTFGELYDHRIELWIVICKMCSRFSVPKVWRSLYHSDGTNMPGWFVLGMNTEPGRQITYHLPDSRWDDCAFAEIYEQAPHFDGHTSADVLKRLREF